MQLIIKSSLAASKSIIPAIIGNIAIYISLWKYNVPKKQTGMPKLIEIKCQFAVIFPTYVGITMPNFSSPRQLFLKLWMVKFEVAIFKTDKY